MSLAHPEDDAGYIGREEKLEERLISLQREMDRLKGHVFEGRLQAIQEEINRLKKLQTHYPAEQQKTSRKEQKAEEYNSPLHYPPSDCDGLSNY